MARAELTTFICLFHNLDRAEAAISELEKAGFQRQAMTSVWQEEGVDRTTLTEELGQLGVPSRDVEHLREGLEKGGVALSLEAPEDQSDTIERIFHHFSADKIDETNVTPSVTPTTASPFVAPAGVGAVAAAIPVAAMAAAPRVPPTPLPTTHPVIAPPVAAASSPVIAADEAVVPLIEEELLVGKRTVDRGGVRVYRRTVDEAVSAPVSLHEEHVVVDRRPVDRPASSTDLNADDQVIELRETEEVPVVAKVARVVEEVHVGVVGTERTEVIEDTVRRTEVEIESVPEPTVSEPTVPRPQRTGNFS